eukprot:IDg17797t1
MAMFPLAHLTKIVSITSAKLKRIGRRETTEAEMLKFFGILILMSRFEFGSKRDLWNTKYQRRALATLEFQRPDFSSIFDASALVCSHLSKEGIVLILDFSTTSQLIESRRTDARYKF